MITKEIKNSKQHITIITIIQGIFTYRTFHNKKIQNLQDIIFNTHKYS